MTTRNHEPTRKMKVITQWAGGVAAIGTAVGIVWGAVAYIGPPPYASAAEVHELREFAANINVAILITQLRIAISEGDKQEIARLCWEIEQITGKRHPWCR